MLHQLPVFAALCRQGYEYDPNETLDSWIANNIPLYGSAHPATDENSEKPRSRNGDVFPPDSLVLSRPSTMDQNVARKTLSDMNARLVDSNVFSNKTKIVKQNQMQPVKANQKTEWNLLNPEGSEFYIETKQPHFCGVKKLGWFVFEIEKTQDNQNEYVRQWTRNCTKDTKPLVFDVNMKPLENPAAAKGAMNVIDSLKVLNFKKSQAANLAKPEEIIKLGVDPRDIFLIYFDGDSGVRFAKIEIIFNFYSTFLICTVVVISTGPKFWTGTNQMCSVV